MKHLVLYHANCMDGFAAACVAAKYVTLFEGAMPGDIEFRAVQYGSPAPLDDVKGVCVYVLDFAYPADDMVAMSLAARAFIWVDHHNDDLRHSVNARLDQIEHDYSVCRDKLFDTSLSGATATWALLFPAQNPPPVLRYVQDRDLWTWALPQSREVSAALDLEYRGADVADTWRLFLGVSLDYLKQTGAILLRHQAVRVAAAVQSARQWHGPIGLPMHGLNVQIVNCPQDISEVGDALCETGADVACMYFQKSSGEWVYSLRSRSSERFPEGVDCRAIASANGGGGHRNAAGFQSKAFLFQEEPLVWTGA